MGSSQAPGYIPAMSITLQEMPALRVAGVRHEGPYPAIPAAFARLGAIAEAAGLLGPETVMLAIYHDDPDVTPAARLRSDAAIVVPPSVPIPAGLTEALIPAGRYVSMTHIGPYEELGAAWARLKQDVARRGHRARPGPSLEIYRNTPATTPRVELRTEIYIPVT
jgi:AraC family transcriptional regulator